MKKRIKTRQEFRKWLKTSRELPWAQELLMGVPEGSRHSSAIRLVGRWYGKGLCTKEVIYQLEAWNQLNISPMSDSEIKSILMSTRKWENPRCTQYMSDKEVYRTIQQIYKESREGR
jgi:hypothetical protein